jgi:type III secretion protein D
MARPLLLKVFSGPHLGAETPLADGEYLVGRGPNCDLIFDDVTVAGEHLKLRISGGTVHAAPLGDARLMVGGQATDGCTVPIREYITIGTTHLAVGYADEPWPLKPLPELKLGSVEPPSRTPVAAEPVATQSPAPPRRRRVWPMVVAASALSLAPVSGWAIWSGFFEPAELQATPPDFTGSQLAEILDRHGVSGTVKSEKGERGWIVQGHVADRETRKTLETELKPMLPDSAIRLWDSETLAAASGEVLAAFRLAVAATPGAPGEVVFRGRVPDAGLWARVRERIRHDVPALASLTDDVLTGTGRTLRDSKGKPVDAATAPPAPPIAISLLLPPPSRMPLGVASSGAKSSAGPAPASSRQGPAVNPPTTVASASAPVSAPSSNASVNIVPATTLTEKPDVAPPALAYQSVSVGAAQWIRLADGTRVSVGGRIAGGYEITRITDEQIEAQRGETRVVYRLRTGG